MSTPYTINFEKEIGRGAFSSIFEGRTIGGRRVAVKFANKPREIEAAENEVKMLKNFIGVLNIVQLIGYEDRPSTSDSPRTFSFAMEIADGSLESLMSKPDHHKGLPMAILIDLVADCAAALEALRLKHTAHRDIKHMNILTFAGSPTSGRRSTHVFKLCDLGGARVIDERGMTTLVGTPNMLHPNLAAELCRQQHNWKTRKEYTSDECDLWSLGCTIFYCCTGQFPFKYDFNDRNLYYRAVTALKLNSDAIGMTHKGSYREGISGAFRYAFEPILEIPTGPNRHPRWFVHLLTVLLRMFFHEPSIEKYLAIVKSMRAAPRRVFVSIDQLSVVDHSDMSADPIVRVNLPPLSKCLGYPDGTDLTLISATSMSTAAANATSIDALRDSIYLVVPMISDVPCRAIPTKRVDFDESRERPDVALIEARKLRIFNALSNLNDADEFRRVFREVSTILDTQFQLLIDELCREPEKLQIVHRFAAYNETACIPLMIMNNSELHSGANVKECEKCAKDIGREVVVHLNQLFKLGEMCREFQAQSSRLEIEDTELAGIRDELADFWMKDRNEILATGEYSLELASRCAQLRTNILKEIFDGKPSKLAHSLILARTLVEKRAEYAKLQNTLLECIAQLEKPFQKMKETVNRIRQDERMDDETLKLLRKLQNPNYREALQKTEMKGREVKQLAALMRKSLEEHETTAVSADTSVRRMEHFLKLLPKLSHHLRKGDCGKIAVIGGSLEYTGAPYFAAKSAAILGADLIHVFCADEAASVIKGYSPDLIVHPGMKPETVIPKLSRMDAIVLGPGLGRNESLWPLIEKLYEFVAERQIPFVIDGDALWFVAERVAKFPRGMRSTILTPNFVEFSRLCAAALNENEVIGIKEEEKLQQLAVELSRKLGTSVYMKGVADLVVTTNGEVSRCATEASLRRCGGQGDLTAGTLALLLFWAKKSGCDWTSAHHEAGIASSWLVRTAGRRCFEKMGRSANTPGILDEIPHLMMDVETRETTDTVHSS
ncbi:unnamed protein product [Caenorhabditis bovis]|uniref:ATP-dependent (S)-NAD(P)H-hydrate dehydratase n=1 Tax=Caenorhabditis bovis TaxID=2654633 RepID=A0A8S1EKR2_9PELO|nr:unnamed protein product [Caenorhabditis bovis]